jgi:hypothetical protein
MRQHRVLIAALRRTLVWLYVAVAITAIAMVLDERFPRMKLFFTGGDEVLLDISVLKPLLWIPVAFYANIEAARLIDDMLMDDMARQLATKLLQSLVAAALVAAAAPLVAGVVFGDGLDAAPAGLTQQTMANASAAASYPSSAHTETPSEPTLTVWK